MGARMLKKGLAVAVILLFIGMSVVPSTAVKELREKPFPINFDGNTLYVGGNGPNNYTTIQSAVDAASGGDTVFVYDDSSPYYESVLLEKSINLVGEDRRDTIIEVGTSFFGIRITLGSSYINGFTAKRTMQIETNNNIIQNNIVKDYLLGSCVAIRVLWSEGNLIQNNILFNCYWGIRLHESPNTKILNNHIYLMTDNGIKLYKSENTLIHGNIINSADLNAIYIFHSSGTNNNVTITNNIIYNNNEGGIHLECAYNKIIGNTIMNNAEKGILLYGDYNIIAENYLKNNDYGIHISSSGEDNLIYHNNFINNTINAYDTGDNIWDNGYSVPFDPIIDGGNYWSDYTGDDFYSGPGQNISGSDGIGDIPYTISGGSNQDNYPLMNPWNNNPPETPDIDGPSSGAAGEEYDYTFIVLDSGFECIYYYIDWGDDTYEDWIGPYPSGQEIVRSHTWDEQGEYTIRAKARDIFEEESDWGYLEVTMPVNQHSYSFPLLQRLLERFPNAFPILRHLLGL